MDFTLKDPAVTVAEGHLCGDAPIDLAAGKRFLFHFVDDWLAVAHNFSPIFQGLIRVFPAQVRGVCLANETLGVTLAQKLRHRAADADEATRSILEVNAFGNLPEQEIKKFPRMVVIQIRDGKDVACLKLAASVRRNLCRRRELKRMLRLCPLRLPPKSCRRGVR